MAVGQDAVCEAGKTETNPSRNKNSLCLQSLESENQVASTGRRWLIRKWRLRVQSSGVSTNLMEGVESGPTDGHPVGQSRFLQQPWASSVSLKLHVEAVFCWSACFGFSFPD